MIPDCFADEADSAMTKSPSVWWSSKDILHPRHPSTSPTHQLTAIPLTNKVWVLKLECWRPAAAPANWFVLAKAGEDRSRRSGGHDLRLANVPRELSAHTPHCLHHFGDHKSKSRCSFPKMKLDINSYLGLCQQLLASSCPGAKP